ncbi:DC1, partial [Arabidopsis thaliana x Arabidopsis arenosa]
MDNDCGIFHMMEKDGKLSLVYRHPIPQTRSPTSAGETASSDDTLLQPFFLCPRTPCKTKDCQVTIDLSLITNAPFGSIVSYVFSILAGDDHSVHPLFWCNNKEFDVNGGCSACDGSYFGTDYYSCNYCNLMYHKECVESPLNIKHPY